MTPSQPSSPNLERLEQRQALLCQQAQAIAITDDLTLSAAIDLAYWIKRLLKAIEEDRLALTAGLNQSLKAINGRYKHLSEPLKQAEKAAQGAINRYMVAPLRAEPHKVIAPVRGAHDALASLCEHWCWEVTDLLALHRTHPKLVIADEKALAYAIRVLKVRELEGVRIFNQPYTTIR